MRYISEPKASQLFFVSLHRDLKNGCIVQYEVSSSFIIRRSKFLSQWICKSYSMGLFDIPGEPFQTLTNPKHSERLYIIIHSHWSKTGSQLLFYSFFLQKSPLARRARKVYLFFAFLVVHPVCKIQLPGRIPVSVSNKPSKFQLAFLFGIQ